MTLKKKNVKRDYENYGRKPETALTDSTLPAFREER
jgi:hypothetical protein